MIERDSRGAGDQDVSIKTEFLCFARAKTEESVSTDTRIRAAPKRNLFLVTIALNRTV